MEGIERDPKNAAVVEAAITLAHALGEKVIAEGVQTEEQLERLRQMGCDLAQGHHFSEPLPSEVALEVFWEVARKEPDGYPK